MQRRRQRVNARTIGRTNLGPVRLLRITYTDGFRSWGLSYNGSLTLFGTDRTYLNKVVRRVI
jgi:hypothetical protein